MAMTDVPQIFFRAIIKIKEVAEFYNTKTAKCSFLFFPDIQCLVSQEWDVCPFLFLFDEVQSLFLNSLCSR